MPEEIVRFGTRLMINKDMHDDPGVDVDRFIDMQFWRAMEKAGRREVGGRLVNVTETTFGEHATLFVQYDVSADTVAT